MIVLDPALARAARAYTGLSHIWLAKKAGVASRTVQKLEKDGKVTQQSLNKILEVFDRFGIEMLRDEREVITAITLRRASDEGTIR